MKPFSISLAGPALALFMSGAIVRADPIQYCPQDADNVCYQIAVPQSSAQSGSGDIFFQISAPSKYQWVALGTGTQMDGSNIFLMYQNGKGNVTLSPRQGAFHVEPMLDTSSTAARLTLLAGSGLSSDGSTITANVKCSNCESWAGGGQLQLSSTTAGWIGAWKEGSSLASTSTSAEITQHDDTAQFQLDLTQAVISDDSNPFSGSSSGGSSGSGSSSSSSGSGGSHGGSGGSGVSVISAGSTDGKLVPAHGLIMALVIVVLYPLGALLMPLFGKWYLHASWQLLTYCLMWAGFAIGIICARQQNILFVATHTICGTTVVCGMAIQPFLGVAHHSYYRKYQKRGVISWVHIWWGRLFMLLGVVNGGLGLELAGAPTRLIIAYSVVAGVIFVGYVTIKLGVSMILKSDQPEGRARDKPTNRQQESGSRSPPDMMPQYNQMQRPTQYQPEGPPNNTRPLYG